MNKRMIALILIGVLLSGTMAMGVSIADADYITTWIYGCETMVFEVQSKDEGKLIVEIKIDGEWQVLRDEPINNGRTRFTQRGFSERTSIRLACTWKDDHNNRQVVSVPGGNGKWNPDHTVLFAQWDFTGEGDPSWTDQTVTLTFRN